MRKKMKGLGLLVLVLPLFAFISVHKFYVSVTHIGYSDTEDALQITTRIFIDDMERLLEERYGLKARLATPEESEEADAFLEKYLKQRFSIALDGKDRPYQFLGKKYDTDVLICYLEVPRCELGQITSIEIRNEVLTDLFEEQQNVVHMKIKDQKKSFVLFKENNKGMLNL